MGVVERAADAGERVHENENILAHFDEAPGAIDAELRDAGVGFDIRVVRTGHEFGCGNGAADFGDFLRALVHKEDKKFHLRVVFHHGIGDVLKKCRLARAGWCDNEAALTLAHRGDKIDNACREALGNRLELDALVRIDDAEFLKNREVLELLGISAFELGELIHLRAAIAPADFAFDPHAVAETVFTDDLGCDENVVVRLSEIAACFAKEAKTLAADFDNALGIDDRSWRLRRLRRLLDDRFRLRSRLQCLDGFFDRFGRSRSNWLRRGSDCGGLNRGSFAGGRSFI